MRPGTALVFWERVLEAMLALEVELEPDEDLDSSDECQAAFDRTLREFGAPGAPGVTLKAPSPWELSPN